MSFPFPLLLSLPLPLSMILLFRNIFSKETIAHTHTTDAFVFRLKKRVYDGVPSENVCGADLRSDFFDLGYELFRDKETLRSTFLTADVFDPDSALGSLDGQIDIVYTGSFFHLFDWDDQVRVATRLVRLLKPRRGSMVMGRQVGNLKPGAYPHRTNAGGTMWRHDPKTFAKMWEDVGSQTATSWRVNALFEDEERFGADWNGPGTRRLRFDVERVS